MAQVGIFGNWQEMIGIAPYFTRLDFAHPIRIGTLAGEAYVGGDSTFVGISAGEHHTLSNSTYYGWHAGMANVTGDISVFGAECGRDTTDGNVCAFGDGCAMLNVHGTISAFGNDAAGKATVSAVCMGYQAGMNTTSAIITAIGEQALLAKTNAGNGTAVGCFAALKTTSGVVTVIGHQAATENLTGNVVAVGEQAAFAAQAVTITAIGYQALANFTAAGAYPCAVGYLAGKTATSGNATFIGQFAGYTVVGAGAGIYLGCAAGYYETAADKLYIDCMDRGTEARNRVEALIYGKFNAATANQFLWINGRFGVLLAEVLTAANNAAAAAAGVLIGQFYRTNADPSILCIRSA
jgi:hypothetical protein